MPSLSKPMMSMDSPKGLRPLLWVYFCGEKSTIQFTPPRISRASTQNQACLCGKINHIFCQSEHREIFLHYAGIWTRLSDILQRILCKFSPSQYRNFHTFQSCWARFFLMASVDRRGLGVRNATGDQMKQSQHLTAERRCNCQYT